MTTYIAHLYFILMYMTQVKFHINCKRNATHAKDVGPQTYPIKMPDVLAWCPWHLMSCKMLVSFDGNGNVELYAPQTWENILWTNQQPSSLQVNSQPIMLYIKFMLLFFYWDVTIRYQSKEYTSVYQVYPGHAKWCQFVSILRWNGPLYGFIPIQILIWTNERQH